MASNTAINAAFGIKRTSNLNLSSKKPKTASEQVEESNEMSINSLPKEMLLKIFSYLTHNELGQISRVCRKWKEFSRSGVLWRIVNVHFCQSKLTFDVVQNFITSCLSPSTSRIRLLSYGAWEKRPNFKDLPLELHGTCPNLEVLILNEAYFSCSFSSFVNLCAKFLPSLKILCFPGCLFGGSSSEENYDDVSHLEVLIIVGCRHLDKPPFPRMPSLKELHAKCAQIYDFLPWFRHDSFQSSLLILNLAWTKIDSTAFRSISRAAHNLTELYVCNSSLTDEDFRFNDSENVFPHLKVICISNSHQVTMAGVYSLVRSCLSLQKIYVKPDIIDHASDTSDDSSDISNNASDTVEIEIIEVIGKCGHSKDKDYLHE